MILSLKNVSKKFNKKSTYAIKNISFDIKPGEFIGFIGDNGAGKTTTIKALFNELRCESGEITYGGKTLNSREQLRDICFFPDSNSVPLNIKLKDYIMYYAYNLGINKKQIQEKTLIICKELDLDEHINKKISELSAGMKKRAILASVLVVSPKILILDEPTANLDVSSKLEMINILKSLNEIGITIFITTHILEELQEIVNRIIIIKKGEIIYNDVFDKNKETIQDIYQKYSDNKTKENNFDFIKKIKKGKD